MLKEGDKVRTKVNGEWIDAEVRYDQHECDEDVALVYYPEHPIQNYYPIANVIYRKLDKVKIKEE